MDLTYLGHSSFKIRGKEGTVVTDPFDPQQVGLPWDPLKADIVTVSHQHPDHNYIKGVKPSADRESKGVLIIDGPGEYEANGIIVQGWQTWHDQEKGTQRGKNIVYLIEVERMRVLHCGDLGHELAEELIEEIGQVDVLLIPVGGIYTIDAKVAVKVTKAIGPSYVVPMHYQVANLNLSQELSGVDVFLKEMEANGGVQPQDKLSVSPSTLPDDTPKVVVMKM